MLWKTSVGHPGTPGGPDFAQSWLRRGKRLVLLLQTDAGPLALRPCPAVTVRIV